MFPITILKYAKKGVGYLFGGSAKESLSNAPHEKKLEGVALDKELARVKAESTEFKRNETEEQHWPEVTYTGKEYISQTCEEQISFFDPTYKGVIFAVDEEGRPAGRYVDEPRGAVVNEDGSVKLLKRCEGHEIQCTEYFVENEK